MVGTTPKLSPRRIFQEPIMIKGKNQRILQHNLRLNVMTTWFHEMF